MDDCNYITSLAELDEALAAKKEIQVYCNRNDYWFPISVTGYYLGYITDKMDKRLLRIKPEPPKPREFWVRKAAFFADAHLLTSPPVDKENWFHVREVLE